MRECKYFAWLSAQHVSCVGPVTVCFMATPVVYRTSRPGSESQLKLWPTLQLQHWGSNPCFCSDLRCCGQVLNSLCHSGNSPTTVTKSIRGLCGPLLANTSFQVSPRQEPPSLAHTPRTGYWFMGLSGRQGRLSEPLHFPEIPKYLSRRLMWTGPWVHSGITSCRSSHQDILGLGWFFQLFSFL